MEKIKEITLWERRDERGTGWDRIYIKDNGDIDFDSYDIGALPLEFFGRDEYEYDIIVKAEWKDTILLHLLKERFTKNSEFREWADEKKIPYTTESW